MTKQDESETLSPINHLNRNNNSTHTIPSASSNQQHPLNYFYADLQRVLSSRRITGSSVITAMDQLVAQAKQRNHRPPILREDLDGAQRALIMLRQLVTIHNNNNNNNTAADYYRYYEDCFALVMQAFCQRHRIRSQGPVEKTITTDLLQNTKIDKTLSYFSSSSSSSSSSSPQQGDTTRPQLIRAADQVQSLLEELTTLVPMDTIQISTFNILLQAYANCATPRNNYVSYAKQAELLLKEHMIPLFADKQQVKSLFLESQLYVLQTHAWEQANRQESSETGAIRAQFWMEELERQTSNVTILMPAYYYALEAWSKCGTESGTIHADACLAKMKDIFQSIQQDDSHALAREYYNAQVYSNAILAWSKQSSPNNKAAERCQELMEEMLSLYRQGCFPQGSDEPPLIAFNGVITAWGRSRRADQAEAIIWLMEDLRKECKTLRPDVVSYNSVLHALLSGRSQASLSKIIRIVEYMEDIGTTELPDIRPDTFTYDILMKAWVQLTDEPKKAEESTKVLLRMVQLWDAGDTAIEPNNRNFNMVINAYAKSKDPLAVRKALDLLERMKRSHRYQPDTVSYTSVLECLSSSVDPGAPDTAEKLLQELFDRYQATGLSCNMPNLRTFTMTILTFVKNKGSVDRAYKLLQQLEQLYERTKEPQLQPNAFPYNYVLNCAANTQTDKLAAFQIASKTYQALRKSKHGAVPDVYTYSFWFKCCSRLLPSCDLRDRCVTYAFDECKKMGLVSNEILTRLFQGNRIELVEKMLEIKEQQQRPFYRSHVSVASLPPSWSRNTVAETRNRPVF